MPLASRVRTALASLLVPASSSSEQQQQQQKVDEELYVGQLQTSLMEQFLGKATDLIAQPALEACHLLYSCLLLGSLHNRSTSTGDKVNPQALLSLHCLQTLCPR